MNFTDLKVIDVKPKLIIGGHMPPVPPWFLHLCFNNVFLLLITELACNISEIMIANGKVSLNADQATYICDSGYTLSDPKSFTCDPNTRQWTSSQQQSSLQLPTCISKHLFVSLCALQHYASVIH